MVKMFMVERRKQSKSLLGARVKDKKLDFLLLKLRIEINISNVVAWILMTVTEHLIFREMLKVHRKKGVADCLPIDQVHSKQPLRMAPIGRDRHGRYYWFVARRIFVSVTFTSHKTVKTKRISQNKKRIFVSHKTDMSSFKI